MQALAIQAGIDRGMLSDLLDPAELGRQSYHGYELASLPGALGARDAAPSEARGLRRLEVALLGGAGHALRPVPLIAQLRGRAPESPQSLYSHHVSNPTGGALAGLWCVVTPPTE